MSKIREVSSLINHEQPELTDALDYISRALRTTGTSQELYVRYAAQCIERWENRESAEAY